MARKPMERWPNKINGEPARNKRAVWSIATEPFEGDHFAVFPLKLVATMIKAGVPENGIVLDPFIGSGTTAIVSERLNRRWIGIELNKQYCEIAKERIKNEVMQTKLF